MASGGEVNGFTGRRIDDPNASDIKSAELMFPERGALETSTAVISDSEDDIAAEDQIYTETSQLEPESPNTLLDNLLTTENQENNNLINIMGNVKPKSATNSLAAIVRGLFTKNSKLLTLLNQAVTETSGSDDKEIFKAFINDFILWLDDDAIKLFSKYCKQLCSLDEDLYAYSFETPLFNLTNYVAFIDGAAKLLRNPFIVDKLMSMKKTVVSIITEYTTFSRTKTLNNISFSNVKVFGSKLKSDKVSGFFKVDQIAERTENEPLYIDKSRVELVLLNFSDDGYNALAILQIENDARSLLYPPFRINELSVDYQHSQIVLKSINFSNQNRQPATLRILGENYQFLANWYKKLSVIFPKEQRSDEEFLIKSTSLAISGLGINVVSDSQHKLDLGGTYDAPLSSKSDTFKELISSPSLRSNSPLTQLQNQFQKENKESPATYNGPLYPNNSLNLLQTSVQQPNPNSNSDVVSSRSMESPNSTAIKSSTKASSSESLNFSQPPAISVRKYSSSSISSGESLKSQYDRSLDIINKALSNHSLKLQDHDKESFIKQINRGVLVPIQPSAENTRPLSSEAQLIEQTPKNKSQTLNNFDLEEPKNMPYSSNFSQSVPNLSKKNIYQLSTGSALDINNFGKDYNPSFSIVKDMNEIIEPPSKNKKPRRKSLFSIFKKTKPVKSTSPYLPQSPIDEPELRHDMTTSSDFARNTDLPLQHKPSAGVLQNQSMNELQRNKSADDLQKDSIVNQKSADEVYKETKPVPTFDSERLESVTSLASKNKKGLTINSSLNSSSDLQSASSDKSISKSKASTIPSAFALPSSTSTYFFKPNKKQSTTNDEDTTPVVHDEAVSIPQDLKNIINNEPSIDFFITDSAPRAIKVSKWKQKYGKYEMITLNEKLFIKIVINYEINKSWIIVFKEEVCDGEEMDIPILLLNIDVANTSIRRSSALDLQISAVNSITFESMMVIVRCSSGNLAHSLLSNIENVLGIFTTQSKAAQYESLKNSRYESSTATITSSIMDKEKEPYMSLTSFSLEISKDDSKPAKEHKASNSSTFSINSTEIKNAQILSNPANTWLEILNLMTIRLQKQLQGYDKVNVLSSWKILSMYTLLISIISDSFTDENFYHFVLNNSDNGGPELSWLIPEKEKFNRIEKIGKAGILVKVDDNDIYMVECKGKKEFKKLFDLF